jgi:putative ABC transport system permease protein
MFVLAVGISFGTVMLSAWLPAKKAARIAAIDAIRGAGEVKIKNAKTSKLIGKIFGFEGTLAAKSLKRDRRNFRATVVSLTISIVLIMVAGAFGSMMYSLTNLTLKGTDATVSAYYTKSLKSQSQDENEKGKPALTYDLAENITKKLSAYPNTEIYGGSSIGSGPLEITEGMASNKFKDFAKRSDNKMNLSVYVSVLDSKHYAELCKIANVPLGSNIFINRLRSNASDGYMADFAPLNTPIDTLTLSKSEGGKSSLGSFKIAATLKGDEVPSEILNVVNNCSIIVPEGTTTSWMWSAITPDNAGFAAHAEKIMEETAKINAKYTNLYQVNDLVAQSAQIKTIFNTILFFVYGFVGMLALIAVTSVISTISTNVRSRSREFAVLQSVGMTQGGIRKMLNLESVMSAVRSLAFGLPLGILGAYGVYRGMGLAGEIKFTLPWLAIAECVIGIFVITWMTMRFTARRMRNENIIDTIRGE